MLVKLHRVLFTRFVKRLVDEKTWRSNQEVVVRKLQECVAILQHSMTNFSNSMSMVELELDDELVDKNFSTRQLGDDDNFSRWYVR